MKILITTQAVDLDDPILGFFHRWIEEFAKHVEQVTVVCLRKGKYTLPSNVRVLSLGKEEGTSKLTRVFRFYTYILRERNNYDHVFVHMNHEYILLGGVLWRMLRKHIGLWYVHKQVTLKLKLATVLTDVIFTASAESFRHKTSKVRIIGHGIDTDFFSPVGRDHAHKGKQIHILSAGRISFAKHHDLIIRACAQIPHAEVTIAGAPITEMDRGYENKLHRLVQELHMESRVHFVGALPQTGIREQYIQSDVFAHASTTGSYDKVVLEALASGVPVVTSSEAFSDGALPVTVVSHSIEGFVKGIEASAKTKHNPQTLADVVKEKHGIASCISQIIESYTG